ncbi:MAG: hypothetical protein K0R31_1401 [Clostridiales bacterium]|nr:hypothetical protein [Clostridiales bacterium]
MPKQKNTCSNCIKGTAISINNDILCRENGAVSPNFVCSKHHMAPVVIKASRDNGYKCIDCENFIIAENSENEAPIGLCRLFSVRQFDGNHKNACSKFEKRSVLEVS